MDELSTITDETKPKKVTLNIKLPIEDDSEESTSESVLSSMSSDKEGFYVELMLSCTKTTKFPVLFNFETEENYMEHGVLGYENIEDQFDEIISMAHPGWDYANEWDEHEIHGEEIPEEYDGIVVDV